MCKTPIKGVQQMFANVLWSTIMLNEHSSTHANNHQILMEKGIQRKSHIDVNHNSSTLLPTTYTCTSILLPGSAKTIVLTNRLLITYSQGTAFLALYPLKILITVQVDRQMARTWYVYVATVYQ